MGGGNLLTILISTVKSRFASITSKIRIWTSWNFIQARIITRIRVFFTSLFDIRPKNSKDYYTIFGWMISKRLAYSAFLIAGIVSLWYIFTVRQVFAGAFSHNGTRTYRYNAIALRYAKDNVRILGKSGYLAYEGQVSKGYVNGDGTLYDPEGHMVYQGSFAKSRYEGNGTTYYPGGTMWYTGTFHDNLYEGTGKLYREDGSLWYDGEFSRGLKNGTGMLCGENGSVVYQGGFAADEIVWASFIGKSTAEAGEMYGGARTVYEGEDMFCVQMKDIGAMYAGSQDDGALSDEVMIGSVYVLSDTYPNGEKHLAKLSDVSKLLGKPIYEGNSGILLPEAVAVNMLNDTKKAFNGRVKMEQEALFSDVTRVNSFDRSYSVYLTSYLSGGLVYTFFSGAKDDTFSFYEISRAEGESA